MTPLKELAPGDDNLLVTAVANKLIKAINALLSLKVVPETAGKIQLEEGQSTLEINLPTTINTVTIENDREDLVTITGTVADGVLTLSFEWETNNCSPGGG